MGSRTDRNFSRSALFTTFGAALSLALALPRIADAATVTVSSTCSVARAVAIINAGANPKPTPCNSSGRFGTGDTVVVPAGNFVVTPVVEIKRSLTIHGAGKWSTTLQVSTSPTLYRAFLVSTPSAVVKIDNLFLAGPSDFPASAMAGIVVMSADDSDRSDNNLELSYVVVSGFTGPGIISSGGRVLVSNTLIYLNTTGAWGAGVHSRADMNSNGTQAVPSFVAKNSAISLNTALSWAGGIYSEGKLDLRSTVLQENQAPDGAAIYEAATFTTGTGKSTWCKVERDSSASVQSEIDGNSATQAGGMSIINSDITCNFYDTIAAGNSSPYCSSNIVGCPQQ
jgi:hypothetical protein